MVQNVGCLKENTYLCNRKSEMNALLAQLVEREPPKVMLYRPPYDEK